MNVQLHHTQQGQEKVYTSLFRTKSATQGGVWKADSEGMPSPCSLAEAHQPNS